MGGPVLGMVSKRVMKVGDNKIGIRVGPLAEWFVCSPQGSFGSLFFNRSRSVPRHGRVGRGREEKSSHYTLCCSV